MKLKYRLYSEDFILNNALYRYLRTAYILARKTERAIIKVILKSILVTVPNVDFNAFKIANHAVTESAKTSIIIYFISTNYSIEDYTF